MRDAMAAMEPVWNSLEHAEKRRVLRQIVARGMYAGTAGAVDVAFRPKALGRCDRGGTIDVGPRTGKRCAPIAAPSVHAKCERLARRLLRTE